MVLHTTRRVMHLNRACSIHILLHGLHALSIKCYIHKHKFYNNNNHTIIINKNTIRTHSLKDLTNRNKHEMRFRVMIMMTISTAFNDDNDAVATRWWRFNYICFGFSVDAKNKHKPQEAIASHSISIYTKSHRTEHELLWLYELAMEWLTFFIPPKETARANNILYVVMCGDRAKFVYVFW